MSPRAGTPPTKVHVVNADGSVRFNRLLDGGAPILRFASGYGFVIREDVRRARAGAWGPGGEIRPGWPEEPSTATEEVVK